MAASIKLYGYCYCEDRCIWRISFPLTFWEVAVLMLVEGDFYLETNEIFMANPHLDVSREIFTIKVCESMKCPLKCADQGRCQGRRENLTSTWQMGDGNTPLQIRVFPIQNVRLSDNRSPFHHYLYLLCYCKKWTVKYRMLICHSSPAFCSMKEQKWRFLEAGAGVW